MLNISVFMIQSQFCKIILDKGRNATTEDILVTFKDFRLSLIAFVSGCTDDQTIYRELTYLRKVMGLYLAGWKRIFLSKKKSDVGYEFANSFGFDRL